VERRQARYRAVVRRSFGDDEDVDVAVAGVVAAQGERAAEVGTDQVIAEGFAKAGEKRVDEGGDFGWEGR